MSTLEILGNISLNLCSFLYLILLIPQVIHNRKAENIAGLSLWLHFLLYISYSTDMVYGIADDMPLQYRIVSLVGLLLVMAQHIQLVKFHIQKRYFILIKLGITFIILHAFLYYYFFSKLASNSVSNDTVLFLGVVARICEIIYCVPQIFKNRITKSAGAVSKHFIYLNLLLAILDTISAWCLNWDWPNKLVAPLGIMVMSIILLQYQKYSAKQRLAAIIMPNRKLSLANAA